MSEIKNNVPKLSEFFGDIIIRFNEFGEKEKIVPVPKGDIKLYTLSELLSSKDRGQQLKVLQTKAEKSFDDIDDISLYIELEYDLIQYLTNIDMDLSKEDFYNSIKKSSPCFVGFIKDLFDHFYKIEDDAIDLSKRIKEIDGKLPKKSNLEIAKNKLEKLKILLKAEKDSGKKKDIIVKMYETQEQINKLENEEMKNKTMENKIIDIDKKESKEVNNAEIESKDIGIEEKQETIEDAIKDLEKAMKSNDKEKINETLEMINKLRDKNK